MIVSQSALRPYDHQFRREITESLLMYFFVRENLSFVEPPSRSCIVNTAYGAPSTSC